MIAAHRRPRRRRHPVPVSLAVDLALIREGLSDDQHRDEVRKLVRASLSAVTWEAAPASPFAHFDDEVTAIIHEFLGEN